ncbi:hypothetical protein PIB30_022752 [Stylosanthes scabra]|uniref:Uncharacterized protein n=1 Tax=Stylosanthes scabra TaxID=79078 RepID=A0ABU6Q8Y9_9FABA|nr:hypothetical protein [Stylosanthes scabra]
MRPSAAHPLCPANSPSSSVSSRSSGSFHHERERSPRTPLPPPAPMSVLGPVHSVPRTPMMDARRYCSLFPRHRVALPIPPPSDDEPSEEGVDLDLEEPYLVGDAHLGGCDVYASDASYGSEQESASVGFGPSYHHSFECLAGSGSIGYGEGSSGSANDVSSDDDLVNRHFAGTFP